jgi:release factor glutamine methyltransferase
MKLQEAQRMVIEGLRDLYEEGEAANISFLALEHLTGFTRTQQLQQASFTLPVGKLTELRSLLQRLQQHEPIQYIMNKAWFYGLELYVDKDVLIPRPETEELVDWVIRDVRAAGIDVFERKGAQADVTQNLKIMDIGTGSGCMALSLKKAMPKAEVWGCDISDRALNVARRNGSELDIRVDFQSVNFLDAAQQKHLPSVDIVVSNPPYVPQSNAGSMRPNVIQFEPHTALFVPDEDALLFYRSIAAYGGHRLHPDGSMYLEIHEELGKGVEELFTEAGYRVEIKKDMQGKDRMVKVVRAI